VEHYMDGLFFATLLNLLAVMMVYKVRSRPPQRVLIDSKLITARQYWDSITKEDLEFSVGQKQNNWEVKELLPQDDPSDLRRNTVYQDSDYASSAFYHNQGGQRGSVYGNY